MAAGLFNCAGFVDEHDVASGGLEFSEHLRIIKIDRRVTGEHFKPGLRSLLLSLRLVVCMPGYQQTKVSRSWSFSTFVRTCNRWCVPGSVHCICCFLAMRLLTTWLTRRFHKYRADSLAMRGSARRNLGCPGVKSWQLFHFLKGDSFTSPVIIVYPVPANRARQKQRKVERGKIVLLINPTGTRRSGSQEVCISALIAPAGLAALASTPRPLCLGASRYLLPMTQIFSDLVAATPR